MRQRHLWYLLGLVASVAIVYGGIFVWHNFRGVGPVIKKPPVSISTVINTTGMPLNLPAGFSISIVADNVPGARVLRFDSAGNLWVSQPSQGQLVRLQLATGKVTERTNIFTGLDRPHGFVFDPVDPDIVYIAEEGKVIRSSPTHPDVRTTLMSLPSGGGHSTRTLGLGPDGKLYVTIGSSCNVCREDNDKRASIWVVDRDGKNQRAYATGLRNTVFFTWRDQELWGTDMGRDLLGDDIPPDEINIIQAGRDYGWPYCYGQKIHDKKFDSSAAASERCRNSAPSTIDLPAHSAPLGLVFVPNDSRWPDEWRGNLILAFHGSWNRSVPTGYKLVRFTFVDGQAQPAQDFITGWLVKAGAIGRPVDVIFHNDVLYISDDKAGVIYKVEYQQTAESDGACRPTGCSGQVCGDQEMTTTCEYKPEYRCYAAATCTRQSNGQCGWTATTELQKCLTDAKLQ